MNSFLLFVFFLIKSSLDGSSAAYHPRWSPYRDMPTYNQLAASSLLSQYNTALGLGMCCRFCFFVFQPLWLFLTLLDSPLHVVSSLLSTRTSWLPSQKSSYGRAGCPDCATGQCCPEKRQHFNRATEQAASSSRPAVCPEWFPGSEGEYTYQ